jgi:hypothetical protein
MFCCRRKEITVFNVRLVSHVLLVTEGLLLIIPNFVGITMFCYCLVFIITNIAYEVFLNYLLFLLASSSFYSLWHIYWDAINEAFEKGKKLDKFIGTLAFIGFVLSIISMILSELSIKSGIEIFAFGIIYVPTYLHLLCEIKRQTGTGYLIGKNAKAS